MDGQGTTGRRNIAENFNRLSRVHQRYRRQTSDDRQTDGRVMTNSEREREFTFAKTDAYSTTSSRPACAVSRGSLAYGKEFVYFKQVH